MLLPDNVKEKKEKILLRNLEKKKYAMHINCCIMAKSLLI